VLEVSQFRQPCWKLDHRFALRGMAGRVQRSGRTGWYARVVTPGAVAAGDALRLVARPLPDWPLHRLWRVMLRETLDPAELDAALRQEAVPEGWREVLRRRRASGSVESWDDRLRGPDGPPPPRPA
jgi:MOSC domain-containing protein YiiM